MSKTKITFYVGFLLAISTYNAYADLNNPEINNEINDKFIIEPSFSVLFFNPKAINEQITMLNKIYHPMKVDDISFAMFLGGYLGYQVSNRFSVGFNAEITPKKWRPDVRGYDERTRFSVQINTSFYFFGIKGKYTFFEKDRFRIYAAPTLGYAQYELDYVTRISDGWTTSEGLIYTSSSGFIAKAAAGINYNISSFLGVYFEGGYLYAKSGALQGNPDSVRNALSPNETLKYVDENGKTKMSYLDYSGINLLVGLSFVF